MLTSASAAGFAYLRSDKPLTCRGLLGDMGFHGLVGAGLGGILHEWYWKTRPASIVAVAIFYGAGVVSFADIKTSLLRMFDHRQS